MIEVVNRQRRRPVDRERWQAFAGEALGAIESSDNGGRQSIGEGKGATVVFVSDRAMRGLNRRFRGKNGTTDVLSFPMEPAEFEEAAESSLGDVVISVEQAARQAAEHGLEFDEEIAQLILHGLLHLKGYDHEADNGEMNRLELRLRHRLGI